MKMVIAPLMLLLFLSLAAKPQITVLPGSSMRGAEVFTERGCIQCHSFNGRGGAAAPDLAQRPDRALTPPLLASELWNHSPSMWARLEASGKSAPLMISTDTADLFAYFYSLLYFTQPGNSAKGQRIFEENCGACHGGARPAKGAAGPPIAKWVQVKDPMNWAGQMWNHSGEMYRSVTRPEARWPVLRTQDLIDLLAYIRSLPDARSQTAAFQPGNPEKGLAIFERECETCHAFGAAPGRKIDLLSRRAPRTLSDYAVAMWNHAPRMNRAAIDRFPYLAEDEMKDLTAYLFAERYFSERGDPGRGARVYTEKGCATCHDERPLGKRAPDLAQSTERFSPITITAALWRSGPAMLEAMKQRNMKWPEFHGSEMTDLIAFLNERLITRIGN